MVEGKVVIVFDVLFATSTMTAALAEGATAIIPAFDHNQAKEKAASLKEPYILAGEVNGEVIEGFHPPLYSYLKPLIKGKLLILSTTNGTVALHRSLQAKRLYAASILNVKAMAEHLTKYHKSEDILIICSGSSGHFTLEDFLGAGCLIHYLQKNSEWKLSDGAIAAEVFYKGNGQSNSEVLFQCKIGSILLKAGMNKKEIAFAAEEGVMETVPVYDMNTGSIKEGKNGTH